MLPVNRDDGFIQNSRHPPKGLTVVLVAELRGAKLQALPPYRFVGDDDPAFSQQLFYFAEAETEAMVADRFCPHDKESAKCNFS